MITLPVFEMNMSKCFSWMQVLPWIKLKLISIKYYSTASQVSVETLHTQPQGVTSSHALWEQTQTWRLPASIGISTRHLSCLIRVLELLWDASISDCGGREGLEFIVRLRSLLHPHPQCSHSISVETCQFVGACSDLTWLWYSLSFFSCCCSALFLLQQKFVIVFFNPLYHLTWCLLSGCVWRPCSLLLWSLRWNSDCSFMETKGLHLHAF